MSDFSAFDLNAILDDVLGDVDVTKPAKATPPTWYHDADMTDKLKAIVDEIYVQFDEKQTFITETKDLSKVLVKDINLVRETICETVGLNPKYLKNYKKNEYMGKVVQLVEALNLRLNRMAEVNKVSARSNSLSVKGSKYDALKADYENLLNKNYRDYAMTVFSENMKDILASNETSNVDLYRENENLKAELRSIKEQYNRLSKMYSLEVQKNQRLSVIDGGKQDG